MEHNEAEIAADVREWRRRPDIDWLRILVVWSLVPFHTARLFDYWEPNYVKNDELSMSLSLLISFFWAWNMPLLFLLAGVASKYALEYRTRHQYAIERIRRLVVPFCFGVLVIVPPQAYLARLQTGGCAGSYVAFLADYFSIRGDFTGYTGLFTPAHLWFILFLAVFSFLALPLFQGLRVHRKHFDWLARELSRPGALLLVAVMPGMAGALPGIGGKNPFFYFVYFLFGYLLASDIRLQREVDRHKAIALVLGSLTMTLTLLLYAFRVRFSLYSMGDVLFYVVRVFNCWFWVVALLGYGGRYLTCTNGLYRYAKEASYPFYLLHQTVIVVIGYVVVQWTMSLWSKFFIITASSFIVTFLVYDLCVRRLRVSRFLFGMKSIPQPPQKAG